MNRREFLVLAAGLAVAGCGGGPDEPAEFDQARNPESQRMGDIEILGFVLTEKRVVLAAASEVPEIAAHEREHVARLEREIRGLKGKPPAAGETRRLDLIAAEENFIAAAIDALPKLADERRRALLAAMMTADAGHVAFLRARADEEPVTDAFVYGRKAA